MWAPNAQRVSVVGNFNQWDGRQHPLRVRGSTGVWEIFIPGLREGEIYKFEIKSRYKSYLGLKSRPLRFLLPSSGPRRPRLSTTSTAMSGTIRRGWRSGRHARVSARRCRFTKFIWARGGAHAEEGHRVLNYRELAEQLADYVKRWALRMWN